MVQNLPFRDTSYPVGPPTKEKSSFTSVSCFALNLPLRNIWPDMADSVLPDGVVQGIRCNDSLFNLSLLTFKGKKLADNKPLTGVGRLTLARVDTLQNFYSQALRDNKRNGKSNKSYFKTLQQHRGKSLSQGLPCG